jgi:EAL domain-containing protein (putative c-di-GMP-specific phosphodiesterase class I)
VIDDLMKLLEQHSLPASGFCIEVTESVFASADAISELQRARKLGFMVAMDDFGIGYSSLSLLPRLPLTSIKLDRSFIVQSDAAGGTVIVTAIVQLAHALKLDIIAEGVERPEQLDLMAECGCDAVQGYIFSRPLEPGGLDIWLSRESDYVETEGSFPASCRKHTIGP